MMEKTRVLVDKWCESVVETLEIIIPIFCVVQLLAGIGIYFADAEIFEWYIKEDGYVETLTVVFLVLTAIVALSKAYNFNQQSIKSFYIFIAIIFLFGAGEEISWGQRIFNFETPEKLGALNTQNDFTVHNVRLNGVKLNKLIFGTVMYIGVFAYFLLGPLLLQKSRSVQNLVEKYQLPVPTISLSLLYFASFFCLMIISHHKVWELQELALTSFVFMSFLYNQFKPFAK